MTKNKTQGKKMPLGDGKTQNVSFCVLSFSKDQLPIQMEVGEAIWQFWLSEPLSCDVLVSQHRPKWIDLLMVLSSYWNTICSVACRQGGSAALIEFSCHAFSSQPQSLTLLLLGKSGHNIKQTDNVQRQIKVTVRWFTKVFFFIWDVQKKGFAFLLLGREYQHKV